MHHAASRTHAPHLRLRSFSPLRCVHALRRVSHLCITSEVGARLCTVEPLDWRWKLTPPIVFGPVPSRGKCYHSMQSRVFAPPRNARKTSFCAWRAGFALRLGSMVCFLSPPTVMHHRASHCITLRHAIGRHTCVCVCVASHLGLTRAWLSVMRACGFRVRRLSRTLGSCRAQCQLTRATIPSTSDRAPSLGGARKRALFPCITGASVCACKRSVSCRRSTVW